ncbi:MAG: hypothetical protein JWO94_685, partial [Verrucomicrobiaceae bacterium]|nr:hypothetical protein [Verrucomicrobiaceae bacterium]
GTHFVLSQFAIASSLSLTASPLITLSSCVTSAAGTVVTCLGSGGTAGMAAGMSISGPGIPAGTTVAGVTSATTFVLSLPATATGTGLVLYALPLVSLTSSTTVNGSTTVNCPSTAGLATGVNITGLTLPAGSAVAGITDATHFTLNQAASGLVPPFTASPVISLPNCTVTTGANTVSCASTAGLASGMSITGLGIAPATTITSVSTDGTTFVLSSNATAGGAALALTAAPLLILTGGATIAGTPAATCASTAGLAFGMSITGTGIPAGTTIAGVADGTHLALSLAATATGTGLTFTASPLVSLTGCATTAGSASVACASTAGLAPGMAVTGTGIPAASTIAGITNGAVLTLNRPATITGTGVTLLVSPLTTLAACVTAPGSTAVTCASTAGLRPNMYVNGNGITSGTLVASVTDGAHFVLSQAATADSTVSLIASMQNYLTGWAVTAGSASVTCDSTEGLVAGMNISGTGIPAGATIISVASPTALVMSRAATASATAQDLSVVGLTATTAGSTGITCSSTAGLAPGMNITGSGIPWNAAIASITDGTHLVLSQAATATVSGQSFTASVPPAFSWKYAYRLPQDYILALSFNDRDAGTGKAGFEIEGPLLLCNDTSRAELRHVFQQTNTTAWDDSFCEAFTLKLAARIAAGITTATSLGAQLDQRAEQYLMAAFGPNNLETRPRAVTAQTDSAWMRARLGGSEPYSTSL